MSVGHFMPELIARLQRVSHFPQRVFFRIYDWRRRDAWEDALSANLFERPRFESFALISSPEGLV